MRIKADDTEATIQVWSWCGVCVATILGCVGCVAEVGTDQEGDEGEPQDVAVAAAALGSVQQVAVLCSSDTTDCQSELSDWSDTHGVFAARPNASSIEEIGFVDLATGLVAWLFTGSAIRAPKYDPLTGFIYYYAHTGSDIMRLGASGSTKIRDTNNVIHGYLAVDSTHVYFADDTGVRKVAKGGGSVTTLAAGSNYYLFAADGNELYARREISSSEFQLRKIAKSGGSTFCMETTSAFGFLTWNSTHFYFVTDPLTTANQIKRMPKACGATSTWRATTNMIWDPQARGETLWWSEIHSGGSDIKSRTGSTTTTHMTRGGRLVVSMHAGPSHLFWQEILNSGATNQISSVARAPY